MPTSRKTNPGIIVVGKEKGSVKCGVQSIERGEKMKCGVESVNGGLGVKCKVWSVKCKV